MQTFEYIAPFRRVLIAARRAGQTLGLVPTMGAFHEGHLSLMRQAKAENDLVIVSLFVNPTQFNDPKDFERYPRDPARDAEMAEAMGVDFLFQPEPPEMYGDGFAAMVTVPGLSDRLEGAARPGHFAGVATVVTKLLLIAGADRAYFGEKDWQQLQVIRRMTEDLSIPTQIIGFPTVREADGLALSSRNLRLTPEQRHAAVVLYKALDAAGAAAEAGEEDADVIAQSMHEAIAAEPLADLDYAVVVHPETLEEVNSLAHGALAAVAARFGEIRLIDNRLLRKSLF